MKFTTAVNVRRVLFVVTSLFVAMATARANMRPDASITMEALSALQPVAGGRMAAVYVETSQGRVTLSGTVPSPRDKARAAADVGRVAGVVQVRNLLQVMTPRDKERARRADAAVKANVQRTHSVTVLPPAPRYLGTPVGTVSTIRVGPIEAEDDVIRRSVITALIDLDASGNAEIKVMVKDGIVWLRGSVPTWQGNSSRLHAVRSVTGVRSINNGVRVVS